MSPRAKQRAGPDDETDVDEEEDSGDDKASEDGDNGKPDGDSLESHIKKVVNEVVQGLLGDRSSAAKSSPAQDEQSIFKMVKDAQATLKKEEEKDAKLAGLGETVEKLTKAVEKAPSRDGPAGRIQRAMWGSE